MLNLSELTIVSNVRCEKRNKDSLTVKEPNWMSKYDTIHGGTPAVWRIVENATEETEGQVSQREVVLTIQGILGKKDLPPFEEKISPTSSHIQYLRQSVTLVGLDTPAFARAIDNVLELHALLGRSVGHSNIEKCGIIGTHGDQQTIEASNRYFTPRKQAEAALDLDIPDHIDPKGYLRNAKGRQHVHIEDNVVHYFELITDKFGEMRFVPTKPIKFQVGDIVEAQVSVILVPLRDKKFKSTMLLRGLTIMDGSFAQQAVRRRLQQEHALNNKQNIATATLKRRVGYVDEELGMTKAKLNRMDLNDRSNQGKKGEERQLDLD